MWEKLFFFTKKLFKELTLLPFWKFTLVQNKINRWVSKEELRLVYLCWLILFISVNVKFIFSEEGWSLTESTEFKLKPLRVTPRHQRSVLLIGHKMISGYRSAWGRQSSVPPEDCVCVRRILFSFFSSYAWRWIHVSSLIKSFFIIIWVKLQATNEGLYHRLTRFHTRFTVYLCISMSAC